MKVKQALDCELAQPDHDSTPAQERGARARERLLQEAIRIFADKGFAKASTREICQAAGQNVASIHYYFGDKAGLYRAALLQPIEAVGESSFAEFDQAGLSLRESLHRLMSAFLWLPVQGQGMDPCTRLHFREMLEPSGAFHGIVVQHILPMHERVLKLLARHVGAKQTDHALQQLAFALVAMVQDYSISGPFMAILAPGLLDESQAEAVLDRLVGYGEALVKHERQARKRALGSPSSH